MRNRKTNLLLAEFWGTYSVLCSTVFAAIPFLVIFAASGIIFPLVIAISFLIIAAVVSYMYAANSATITIDRENREIMNILKGKK